MTKAVQLTGTGAGVPPGVHVSSTSSVLLLRWLFMTQIVSIPPMHRSCYLGSKEGRESERSLGFSLSTVNMM